jgi:hypothetical protein
MRCSRIALGIRHRRRRLQRKTPLLAPCTLLAPLAVAGAFGPLPSSSLADKRRVCSLDRLGQRRASLAPFGGARFPTLEATTGRVGHR